MTRYARIAMILVVGILPQPALAKLNVFACEPEWAALAEAVGGSEVNAYAATTALQDPHRIEARPSLIAKLRRADLLICSGADLEVGWLPMLLRQAGNKRVQPGQPGYLEAAAQVERLDVGVAADRALGDVHTRGNPHVHLDPRRMARIAEVLASRMAQLDAANADHYRATHNAFAQRWQDAINAWQTRAGPLHGVRVVVHHKDWRYLFDWLGLVKAGTLEPKPGLPPGAGHLSKLKAQLDTTPARMVIHAAYQDSRPARWLSQKAGIPAVELPYTVGGSKRAHDLFTLYDDTIERLLTALQ